MAVYNYITVNGVIIPDTDAIYNDVVAEYQQAFGMDLVVTPSTPQGLLVVSETAARTSVADNNAALANQINPNVAGGVFIDAIGALTGTFRNPATPSTVVATLTGVTGTIVPQGSRASDSVNNNIFETTETVTLVGGTATVLMRSIVDGPIVASAGTLTQILSNVIGWEEVTNADSATLGTETQSDEQFRNERRVTLFAQGASTAGAIISAVNLVEGVTSMSFLENVAATTQVIEGVTMVAHSIYACVDGGTDLDVATAMQNKKSAGASYNNGASLIPVSQDVVVPYSNQTITVLFDRPNEIEIGVAITVLVVQPVQDPVESVQQAILTYANGLLDGFAGLVVGANVSPWEIGGAVTSQHPGIYVQSLQIKKIGDSYDYIEIPIEAWEVARIQKTAIVVTVL